MRFKLSALVGLVAFGLLALAGTASAQQVVGSAGAKQITSPRPVQDDFDARLASDGKHLWLVRTGRKAVKDQFSTQVFAYRGGVGRGCR